MKNFSKKRKKILVALSGGVDSSVAAKLLKEQRYNVLGVYFIFTKQIWKSNFQVKKIAKKLGIPLKIIDVRKQFKKRVIDYFLNAYRNGQTPNPCVVCNKEIKFRLLFDLMKKEKADFISTGHYARIKVRPFPSSTFYRRISQGPALFKAKDKTKDQSYFLYRLNQRDLAKIVFPLGNYKKSEVKKIAKKVNLPVAENESQDICFLANQDINYYLSKYIKPKPGDVVDKKGNVLGKHKGLSFYTIGQRKGIEIGGTGPYWVMEKNIQKNELVVTNNSKELFTKKFQINETNWIKQKLKFPLRAEVQIRYRAKKVSAIIRKMGKERWEVRSKKPLRAVTAGQSAVFYKKGEVLGGGTIDSIVRNANIKN